MMMVKIEGANETLKEIEKAQELLSEASKILYHIAMQPVKLEAECDRENQIKNSSDTQ